MCSVRTFTAVTPFNIHLPATYECARHYLDHILAYKQMDGVEPTRDGAEGRVLWWRWTSACCRTCEPSHAQFLKK